MTPASLYRGLLRVVACNCLHSCSTSHALLPCRKKGSSNVEAVRPGRFLTTVNITQVQWSEPSLHVNLAEVGCRRIALS